MIEALTSVGTHQDDGLTCSPARFPPCQNTTKMLYTIDYPKENPRTMALRPATASLWASPSSVTHGTDAMALTRISNIQWEICEQYPCAMPVPIRQSGQLCHCQNRRDGPHETPSIKSFFRLFPNDFLSFSTTHSYTFFSLQLSSHYFKL